ncbi:hypothetical protein CLAFUW4_08644 [Fulvia fulva]|uniref:Uncharacterized protein n=1 Tax=Passalora fulva TaxID=5499 RepID=A0A9Q8LDQ6_PASFU|nr:uncharacterized protein CLAFUR5_08743 [Fulvia fulva]KAK4629045.1 hypothetical protein CLAFUR4_08646 [Fulvia fulva]KAK4630246.1 hypothetical protein CLAFUR0_08642 [Fulvia fulva]UJO15562.1 hypothetical protein CLAFUR5_08743 [Fulvia fulva]WPV12044.1 hypothetical protein CLAFUW4_08644 [Fulvia fulva]WPV26985.1 hypothetical protein CLAFUW7_08641 [Fulvia fulva]
MDALSSMINYGIAGRICLHVASERGWTSEWKTVQYRKKRTPSARKVIQMSTESVTSSSDACDSAVVMSDAASSSTESASTVSSDNLETPDFKKSTSRNNSFACLAYFYDWDEQPDDFCIHLAGVDFEDKKDPYLVDTEDVYLYDCPITNVVDLYEDLDRVQQQLEWEALEAEEEEMARQASLASAALAATLPVEDTKWCPPSDWLSTGPLEDDSISNSPSKFRHVASYIPVLPEKELDPSSRDFAGTGCMSALERKQRLHSWLMASEQCGDWCFSRSERSGRFRVHTMNTEHMWKTRSDEDWEGFEDGDDEGEDMWSWDAHPCFADVEYEEMPVVVGRNAGWEGWTVVIRGTLWCRGMWWM